MMRSYLRSLATIALTVLALACGGDDGPGGAPDAGPPPSGPYDEVDLAQDLRFDDLEAPVHVVRDELGILHIHAENTRDLAFVQGYMMAHDRLPQMDILRRFGAGELGELFGAADRSVIETDMEMRVHRMRPLAEESMTELRSSSDPTDARIVAFLDRFADGVNAYNDDLVAGEYELDPLVQVSYDPQRFREWTAVDSLVLGRFQQFSLSYDASFDIENTDIYQTALEVFDESPGIEEPGDFDPDRDRRRGAAYDLVRMFPIGTHPTIDGFPNLTDTGSRADGSGTDVAAAAPPRRPRVPRHLLRRALELFRPELPMGPHAFMRPKSGSNNWVVGPRHAGGKALLAGDQHLSLPNPSIFYPVHLVVPGELDAEGVTFPGIPGIILGHNGKVAWSATVAAHDVNDVYLETIVPCSEGGGDCVIFDGGEVPIETVEEEFGIGALGTITDTETAVYEYVPHHGPIIPTIEDGAVVPRSGSEALSVKYTGHTPSFEIRTLWELSRAENVDEAFDAFEHYQYGAQNWVIIDNGGNIGWTTNADIPLRDPNAYTWHPEDDKHGLSPMFVLPGDGSAEWQGLMPPRFVPHAINPEQGYLVTANSDPVGATFDGNPLNQQHVSGRPLFASGFYAPGLRTARITNLLLGRIAASGDVTLEDMAEIQHDTRSTMGERLRDRLVELLSELESADKSPAVVDFESSVSTGRRDRVLTARDYLLDWSLETPPAVGGSPTEAQVTDSVATSLFNVWMHYFLDSALGDEYAEIGWDVHEVNSNLTARVIHGMLIEPETLDSFIWPQTDDPVLCDDMNTEVQEDCAATALKAMDQALEWLRSAEGFGSDELADYRWGAMHRRTFAPLFPEANLEIPPPNPENPDHAGGFPTAGDNFVVNRADGGWSDLDFDTSDGPAQRFVAEVEPGGTIRARMSLPGGTVYDRMSKHYRDLLDDYYLPGEQFDLPYSTSEIVSAGEERWVFRSP